VTEAKKISRVGEFFKKRITGFETKQKFVFCATYNVEK